MSDTQDDVALLHLQPLQEITLRMMDKLVQKTGYLHKLEQKNNYQP